MEGAQGISSSTQILDIPPIVMEEFCRCMDCLNEWEWMRFASHIISDTLALRRIHLLQRTGISITRELLWSWGQRMPTIQDLVDILRDLELYRAMDILLQAKASPAVDKKEGILSACEKNNRSSESKTQVSSSSDIPALPVVSPLPPPPPLLLLNSVQLDQSDSSVDMASPSEELLSIPQQESSLVPSSSCKLWTGAEVKEATEGFSSGNKIHCGEFADIFKGRRTGNTYAVKCLKQEESKPQNGMGSYFQTEAQISFRCNHSNLLLLLGFCVEDGQCCLINKFMKNGSLDTALEKNGADILSWEKRLSIAMGLLRAVCHLHNSEIFHGNIKSSNVFLDEDLSPKLGHSGLRFCPDKAANYTQAKTKDLQKYNAYLPDSFLRNKQLTGQTDLFSCGVVLTEILTGMKAYDKDRQPMYLKELILEENDKVIGLTEPRSKMAGDMMAESLCARQISQKYTDTRGGRLMENAAFYFASAICLCLTKKKIVASEVYAVLEKAEHLFRGNKKTKSRPLESKEKKIMSLNTPEEMDDSEDSPLEYTGAAIFELPSSSSKYTDSPDFKITKQNNQATNKDSKRNCVKHDESDTYWLPPGPDDLYCSVEMLSSSDYQPTSSTAGAQDESCVKDTRNKKEKNYPCESSDSSFSSSGSNLPSWDIRVNNEKKKLMENIELYKEDRLDSTDLFEY
ncbi:interleukin-1 receptor-associated kinase-like 2 [Pelobates fuscus]|uniref:interleukin-1 receptor-associated kinase-like 2 n=1 Tax=Pelobates fuscus TaxID=191477 RepID=UPI002FE4F3DA